LTGIRAWLFGEKPMVAYEPASTQGGDEVSESRLSANFIEIPSHHFFGQCSRSPNNRYTLGWCDANESGTHGGARSSGLGRYILLEGKEVIAEGKMPRPNDGKVADNGTFILNDWEFGCDLSGVFSAFRSDGRPILSRRFKANLYNNGLSATGRLAVCQTCNSPDQNDGSILTVFDLEYGKEIASWLPESGWATSYGFPPDAQTIVLTYSDGSAFSYSLNGDFIDRVKWATAELEKGNLFVVQRLLRATENRASTALINKLIDSIDIALRSSRADDRRMRAWGQKLRGRCLELLNDRVGALSCYEEALGLDPKIGVKRRLDQLRRNLAT
jgi:hypothetical protein